MASSFAGGNGHLLEEQQQQQGESNTTSTTTHLTQDEQQPPTGVAPSTVSDCHTSMKEKNGSGASAFKSDGHREAQCSNVPSQVPDDNEFTDALEDERGGTLVTAETETETIMNDVRYHELQNELEVFKRQLVDTETSFHRRKVILEQELRDNEEACQSKIEQFQSKFSRLADEAKKSETNYKNEIFMLEESITQLESAWRARMDHLERRLGQQSDLRSKENERLLQVLDQKIKQQEEEVTKEIERLGDHLEFNLGQQNEIHSKDLSQFHHQITQRLDKEKETREKEVAVLINHINENDCELKASNEEHKEALLNLERTIERQAAEHRNEIDGLIHLLHQQEDILRSTHEEHEALKQNLEQTIIQNHESNLKAIECVANQASQKEEVFKELLASQKEGQEKMTHSLVEHVKMLIEQQKEVHDKEIKALVKHVGKNEHEIRRCTDSHKATIAELIQRFEDERAGYVAENASLSERVDLQAKEIASVRRELDSIREDPIKEISAFRMELQTLQCNTEEHFEAFDDYKEEQENVKQDFQKTFASHRTWFKELETNIKQQSVDILAATDEFNAGKEDVDTMVQSWMNEYENMHLEVEAIVSQFNSTQGEVASTNEALAQLRKNVEKIGESWESLFEHLASQVQEDTDERKAVEKEHEAAHKALEDKIEIRNKDVDQHIQRIENSVKEQVKSNQEIQKRADKHENDMIMLQQNMGASDMQIETFEKQLNEQAEVQTKTRSEFVTMRDIVTELQNAGDSRYKGLENKIEQETYYYADLHSRLERSLQEEISRLNSAEARLDHHEKGFSELSSEAQEQKARHSALMEVLEKARSDAKYVNKRKHDFDGLLTDVKDLQHTVGVSNSQIDSLQKKLTTQSELQSSTTSNLQDLTVQVENFEKTSELRLQNLEGTTSQHLEEQESKTKQLQSWLSKQEDRLNDCRDWLIRFDNTFPELQSKVQHQKSALNGLGERLDTVQRETTERFGLCQSGIEDLAIEVLKGVEQQATTNESMQQEIAEHSRSISSLQEATIENSEKLQKQDNNQKAALSDLKSKSEVKLEETIEAFSTRLKQVQLQADEERKLAQVALTARLDDHNEQLTKHGSNLVDLFDKFGKLRNEFATQSDALDSASKARIAIQNDLQNMIMSLEAKDRELAEQLEGRAKDLAAADAALRATLEEQIAAHETGLFGLKDKLKSTATSLGNLKQEVEANETKQGATNEVIQEHLEQVKSQLTERLQQLETQQTKFVAKIREHHEAGLRGLDSKLNAAATSFSALKNAAESQAGDQKATKETLEQLKSQVRERFQNVETQQTKLNKEFEAGFLGLEVKLDVATTIYNDLKKSFDAQAKDLEYTKAELQASVKERFQRLESEQSKLSIDTREQHEAGLRDISVQLDAATSSFNFLKGAIESEANKHEVTKNALEQLRVQIQENFGQVESQQSKFRTDIQEQHEAGLRDLNNKWNAAVASIDELKRSAEMQASEATKGIENFKNQLTQVEVQQTKDCAELQAQCQQGLRKLEEKLDSTNTTFGALKTAMETQATKQKTTKKALEQLNRHLKDRLDYLDSKQEKYSVVEQHETSLRNLSVRMEAASSSLTYLKNVVKAQQMNQQPTAESRRMRVEEGADALDEESSDEDRGETIKELKQNQKKNHLSIKKRREEIRELIASARTDVCFSITEVDDDDEARDSASTIRE